MHGMQSQPGKVLLDYFATNFAKMSDVDLAVVNHKQLELAYA